MSDATSETFAAALRGDEIHVLRQRARLPAHYLDDLQDSVAPLAAAVHQYSKNAARPILVGLNGCQGSGKSTLGRFLCEMLHIGAGLRCVVVSIDDFYFDKATRRQLAHDVHPLLITRGVPGTHDLSLARKTLEALLDPTRQTAASVPFFDKATDDRAPVEAWPSVAPGVDIVILEGWCVGCPAEDEARLAEPVNELEKTEDANGVWRRYINDQLKGDYQALFERLDLLVMLAAPSFECVYEWREQQERHLAESIAARGESAQTLALLTGPSLQRFIHHFERLTRHQLSALPALADAVIELAANHRMVAHTGPLFS